MPSDRIRYTLDYLVTRNALAYQYFLEALILTGNVHIANILEPDYQNSEQCRRLIEREMIFPHQNHRQQQQQQHAFNQATTSSAASNNNNKKTTDDKNEVEGSDSEQSQLQYPTACSQNHPMVEQLVASCWTASYPNSLALAALIAATEQQQQQQQNYQQQFQQQHRHRPPLHPNHHLLAMRRQPTYSPMSSSRSNSSTNGLEREQKNSY